MNESFGMIISSHGLSCSETQLEQFERYYRLLIEWNEKMNLTAITDYEEVYIKHFFDSLTVALHANFADSTMIADIGAGAGFPSIPLKILFPQVKVTIIDSLNKRIQFLNHLINQLLLSDIQCIHGRAEDLARSTEHRERYDIVTARAVARLPVLNELCLPFVRPDGLFIAMKGSEYQQEIAEAKVSLRVLKAKIEDIHVMNLPGDQAQRAQIHIKKIAATPTKYPRKAGTPLKQPLI